MRTDAHAIGEARSLAYHREIARMLDSDPTMIARALERTRRYATAGLAPHAMQQWDALLRGPVAAIAVVLIADDERGRWLRSCSPFAGEIAPAVRRQIWHDARAQLLRDAADARSVGAADAT